jgi:hypothetical protein
MGTAGVVKSPPVSISPAPVANNGNNIGLLTLLSELEEKVYLYVNSTTQSCPKKIFKTFLIKDFFHLSLVSSTQMVHLELRISP